MRHASVVVTAEHSVPIYPSEEKALAATGNKYGSGNSVHWAVWLQQGDNVELVAHKFTGLREAEEYALELAKDIVTAGGRDEWEAMRLKWTRVN